MNDIDYRRLLAKYVLHVSSCEGIDFLQEWHRSDYLTEDEKNLIDETATAYEQQIGVAGSS